MTQTRRSEWCDACRASVIHDVHPEFGVTGTVTANSEFGVDVLALIHQHPADWDRIREDESDIAEAVNVLICEQFEDAAIDTFSLRYGNKAFFHGWDEEPEIDWREPREDTDFFARLEAALEDAGLWGTPPEPAHRTTPIPGQLTLNVETA